MPRGVTDQFLKILDNERRTSVRTALAMGALTLLAYVMAELTDEPLLGFVVWTALLALVVGGAGGAALAWWRTKRYNDSLRGAWNQWMRASLACAHVDEIERQVHQKGRPLPVASVGWGVLFVLNAFLFAALWIETSWATNLGYAVTLANGLVIGALVAGAAWTWRWAKQFHKALDELVTEGQVGLWGEI